MIMYVFAQAVSIISCFLRHVYEVNVLVKAVRLCYSVEKEQIMPQKNLLAAVPPYAVEETVRRLGGNLRTARLRRNMSIADAASRIGTGVRAVRDAEHGKATTAIGVYFALMWLYDLLPAPDILADPDADAEGKRLVMLREPKRAGRGKSMDNDF